jgi:hypothetical protein
LTDVPGPGVGEGEGLLLRKRGWMLDSPGKVGVWGESGWRYGDDDVLLQVGETGEIGGGAGRTRLIRDAWMCCSRRRLGMLRIVGRKGWVSWVGVGGEVEVGCGVIVEREEVVSKEFGRASFALVVVVFVFVSTVVVVLVNDFCRQRVPPENRCERRGYFRSEERRVSNLNSSGSQIRLGGVRVAGLSGNVSSFMSWEYGCGHVDVVLFFWSRATIR